MVIQSNMTPKAITKVWGETLAVFRRYNVPITEKTLQELVDDNLLPLLVELNNVVGSSNETCIDGG